MTAFFRRPAYPLGRWMLACLLLLLVWPSAAAGDAPRFTALTAQDGLSQDGVQAVVQDRQGFIWIGTGDGLNRYDGYAFRVFRHDPSDPASLLHSHINTLMVDGRSRLWVGTAAGLNLLHADGNGFDAFVPTGPLGGRAQAPSVTGLAEGRDGRIWVATWGSGLYRFSPENGFEKNYVRGLVHGLDQDRIQVLLAENNGTLWLGTAQGGLVRFDTAREQFVTHVADAGNPQALADNRIHALRRDAVGRLWVGHGRGVDLLDPASGVFSRFDWGTTPPLPPDTAVTAVGFGRAGVVWLGTRGQGVFRIDREMGETAHIGAGSDDFPEDHVSTVFTDRGGVVWVGGAYKGLFRHDPAESRFRRLTHLPGRADSLPHPCVQAVAALPDGPRFFGTPEGLAVFDPETRHVQPFGNTDGPEAGDVRALCLVGDVLWVGTHGGGVVALDRTGAHLHEAPGATPGAAQVYSLAADPAAGVWVGTGHGLFRYDRGGRMVDHWAHEPQNPYSLSSNEVRVVFPAGNGDLWVGTMGSGLNRTTAFRPGEFQRYEEQAARPGSLSDNRVLCMAEDLGGRLWIGTAGGLNRFDGEQFTRLTSRDGLPGDFIAGILVDGRDRLWVAGTEGLACYDQQQGDIRRYDREDGLQNDTYRGGACFAARNGEMFFGGMKGVDVFFPGSMGIDPLPPTPVITFVDLRTPQTGGHGGEVPGTRLPVQAQEALTVDHHAELVRFSFSGLHFANPGRNRYAYRLVGLDPDWVYTDATRRVAAYTRLLPGTYTFRVKAANKDGVWSREDARLQLTVLPPPWRTWWAYLLYGAAAAACLLLVIRVRYQALKRSNADLAAQVLARTAEVEGQRALVEAQNARLADQNKRLETQKREIEVQAGRLRELYEVKTRFFADVSHEFRTPLTLTIGPLEDLLAGYKGRLSDDQRHYLELMLRNSRRLLELINQLLDVSKLEAGHMVLRPINADLAAFIGDHVGAFAAQAERAEVQLDFVPPPEPMVMGFDPDKMRDILENLLSNAFKHTRAGGKVRVGLWRSRSMAVLSVKDTGVGMPAARIPHIFNRFYQGEDESGAFSASTGIGLALVKELTALHEGRVEVASRDGEGTEFLVYLPMRTHATAVPLPEALPPAGLPLDGEGAPTSDTGGGRGVVLVIDDNDDIRGYLRGILGGDYDVVPADNGREGLELAARLVPDVVITDVMMPELDGFEVCRRLKGDLKTSHIPVILLTALTGDGHKIQGLEGGADDYLVKPFNAREVHLRIDNLIESRRRLREKYTFQALTGSRDVPSVSEASEEAEPGMDDRFIGRVVEIVRAHMSNARFGVAELAEEVGLSRRQLLRKVNALTGSSPTELVRRLRLEQAADLLRRRQGNVSEVAYAVGFETPAHFSKLFRKQFGRLPSEMVGEPDGG